jgi:drug/metabolite transporter superfamily protein YnfA
MYFLKINFNWKIIKIIFFYFLILLVEIIQKYLNKKYFKKTKITVVLNKHLMTLVLFCS